MSYKYRPQRSDKKRKSSNVTKIFTLLGVIAFIMIAAVYYIYSNYREAIDKENSDSTEQVDFQIIEGESIDSIASNLIEKGLLREEYKDYFIFYLKRSGEGSKFQAGHFRIPKNLSIKEISITLQDAGIPDLWVTIPEGLRKDEIAQILSDAYSEYDTSVFSSEEFLAFTSDPEYIASLDLPEGIEDLEGFLFPDKYLLPVEATSEYVLNVMVNTFTTKVGDAFTYEDVIVASMLEREGRNDEERAMISDIIRRRLEEGWFLNIDATLLYYYKDWKHPLTFSDLETDQPYNTYTNFGLPPTPISNPGLSSIEASRNPTPNNYYYYLHDNTGQIHYAVTLEEHNLNQVEYL